MQTILILGDCQSNGNNCLAHEITQEKTLRTWSMRFHKEFRSVFKWYMRHRRDAGIKTPMPEGNLESVVWHYFWEEEQKVAWPNLLHGNIINFSKNGGHFIGHHHRLKQYLANNAKPDHVIVTDYTFSHKASAFKFKGKQYVFERESYVDAEWNPTDYPVEVHRKRLASIEFQKNQSREWHIRRHQRGFDMLIKLLKYHGLSYSIVRFGDPVVANIEAFDFMGRQIDCIPYYQQYTTLDGENSEVKLGLQADIAAVVVSSLSMDKRSPL